MPSFFSSLFLTSGKLPLVYLRVRELFPTPPLPTTQMLSRLFESGPFSSMAVSKVGLVLRAAIAAYEPRLHQLYLTVNNFLCALCIGIAAVL